MIMFHCQSYKANQFWTCCNTKSWLAVYC